MNLSFNGKRLLYIITHELFTFTLTLIGIAVLIWTLGPLIAIGGKTPFSSALTRCIITALVVLLACSKKFKHHIQTTPSIAATATPAKEESLEVDEEITFLQSNIKLALEFINNIQEKLAVKKASELPWYLVIGPQTAGKSALLANSELEFITAPNLNKKASEDFAHISHCNFWFTRDAVMLDVPGRYTDDPQNNKNSLLYWQKLLGLLKENLASDTVKGIVITLSMHELISQSKQDQEQQIRSIKQRIQNFVKTLGSNLSIYLVITKMDNVAGFNEFFSYLSGDDRHQSWGVTFKEANRQNLSHTFTQEYDHLIKRIHDRLIWRLHQERDIQKRTLIKEFPLQMESLKNLFATLVYHLADVAIYREQTCFKGIYFCSSTHTHQAIDRLLPALSSSFALQPVGAARQLIINKPYFIHELFMNHILGDLYSPKEVYPLPSSTMWMRRTSYGIALFLIITSTSYWSNRFNERLGTIQVGQEAVLEYKVLSKQAATSSLPQILTSLNTLQKAIYLFDQASSGFSFDLALPRVKQIQQTLHELYQQSLEKSLLPSVRNTVTQNLSTHLNSLDPLQLYKVLKAYLILGDGNRSHNSASNPQLIEAGVLLDEQHPLNALQAKALLQHLNNIFTAKTFPVQNLDKTIVHAAREALHALPKDELSYLLLKDQYEAQSNGELPIKNDNKESPLQYLGKEQTIPTLFSAKSFFTIYSNDIPRISHAAVQGDWVLGDNTGTSNVLIKTEPVNTVIEKVQAAYLNDYTHWWTHYVENIQLKTPNTIEEAIQDLNSLARSTSPMLKLLKTLSENTNLAQLLPSSAPISLNKEIIRQGISNHFARYNDLAQSLSTNQVTPLGHILINLVGLQKYLLSLAKAEDGGKAAFMAARSRMESNTGLDVDTDPFSILHVEANQSPEPMRTWLNSFSSQSWKLVVDSAQTHINTQWQAMVVTEYNNYLKDRYPLFKNGSTDITLENFSHFFSPGGTLDNFFAVYIKPFIERTNGHWAWKTIDGVAIKIPLGIIQQFERAALIQRSFYPLGNQQLSLRFLVQPLAFDQNVKTLIINLNGQVITNHPNTVGNFTLIWPGVADANTVTLTAENSKGESSSILETGTWAWFKMLDKFNIKPSNNNLTHFDVRFNVAGNSAKYVLSTPNNVNPFTPGLLEQFRCPEKLEG